MNYRPILAGFVLAASLASSCFGQVTDSLPYETFGMSNGKLWNQLPKDGKLVYLIGLMDAVKWKVQENGVSDEEYRKASLREWSDGYTRDDYIQVLNDLYRQPEAPVLQRLRAANRPPDTESTGT